jgi:signal transduction histidine kinase
VSDRSKTWIVAASALVFAQAGASLILRPSFALIALSDITQCILLLSGTLSFLPNVLANRGRTRLFWALMMLGMASWLAYQLLWNYFEIFLRKDVPNPFWGDVVLFLHIVPMMAALALQPHLDQDHRTARLGALDFTLLLIWWIYLYLYAVIPWQYASSNATTYEHNLNVLYLTEKMAFLSGLAVVWARSQGSWRTVYAHWFGASFTYALSSYLANWAIEKNVYYTGSLYDVPLAASMAWVTGVGLLALERSPKPQASRNSGSHGVWVARLGMIAVSSLPLFAAWSVFDQQAPSAIRTFRLTVTLGAMMAMGAMVFLKQYLLDHELLRLLRTSQESFEDLRRVQAQLVQSEKLASLGQLVGGAAHELNNPLTAMLGYSELLASMPLDGEPQALAEKIGHQVRRTKALVSSLLSFARQGPAEKMLLDVNALAHTAIKLCQPQLAARNVQVETQLADELPPILGDSNQLLQVCLHIANNTLTANPEGDGTLTVRTMRSKDLVVLEFSDEGSAGQHLERVFDRSDGSRPGGHAAEPGLSACYGVIQEHGGKIFCQSRPDGVASFRIELPAASTTSPGLRGNGMREPEGSVPDINAGATLTLPPTP